MEAWTSPPPAPGPSGRMNPIGAGLPGRPALGARHTVASQEMLFPIFISTVIVPCGL